MRCNEVRVPGQPIYKELLRPRMVSRTQIRIGEGEEYPTVWITGGPLQRVEVSDLLLKRFGHRWFLLDSG